MPRYVTVTPHLTVDDLEHRYRHCRVAVERTHWHIVWLVAQGRHVPEVATLVGYTANWVREIIRRYNANGAAVPGSQVSCGGAITCALRIAISPTSALTPRWKSAYPRSGRPVPHRNPLAVLLRSPELWRGSSHVRACSRVDVLSRESSGVPAVYPGAASPAGAVTTWVFRLRSTYRRQPSYFDLKNGGSS